MVTLSDYQFKANSGIDNQVLFGGQTSVQDLDNLQKALSAGSTTGRETTNLTNASGSPLKVEALDRTLKNLTYGDAQIVFWKDIPKSAAMNTVEEYNQLTSYGVDRGGFYSEGETPNTEDSTYVRRAQLVKYLGVVKEVTHQMTLVNTMVGDIIKREIDNGTLWILRKLDRALFTADSSIIPDEFNGMFTQHQNNSDFSSLDAYYGSNVVVDLRGASLTEAAFENAANGLVENYGIGTDFYSSPRVISDFAKNFYGNKFVPLNTDAIRAGVVGQRVQEFQSQFGPVGLHQDIFMNPAPTKAYNAAATSTLAPTAPVADGTAPAAATSGDASSLFVSGDAGNYYYGVTAVNKYGESAITMLGTAVAVIAGGGADLKWADGGGANPATGYTIYRSQKNAASAAASTFYPLFSINATQLSAGYDGAAATKCRDRNRVIGGTYQALLIQKDQQILEFKQLAPLMKMDLAIVGPAFRFMLLLYGTPFLYAPKKMIRFVNIGKAA